MRRLRVGLVLATAALCAFAPAQTLRLLRIIGWLERERPAWEFRDISAVQLLADGRVAVLERSSAEVRIFDGQGQFLRAFGTRGRGVGQSEAPGSLVIRDSLIHVGDARLGRIVTWSLAGRHVEDRAFTPLEHPGTLRPMRHGWAIATTQPGIAGDGSAETHTRVLLLRGGRVDTLRSYGSGIVHVRRAGALPEASSLHSGDAGVWAASGDSLLVLADGLSGAVEWFRIEEAGPVEWNRVELEWDAQPIQDGDLAAAARRLGGRGRRGRAAPDIMTATHYGRIDRMIVSDDATAWLRMRDAFQATDIWLLVTPGGSTRRLLLPQAFTPLSLRGRTICGILRERDGTLFVALYWLT